MNQVFVFSALQETEVRQLKTQHLYNLDEHVERYMRPNQSFSWVWLTLTRNHCRWNGESFSFRQASHLFQSLPRLDVLIAQIPGSFHLALVVVDLAMVAGGRCFFFFSSWRDIWETKRMKGRWRWPLITPFLFQVISSCNDECIDLAIFPVLKKKSRVSKRMQLLARTTRAASLAFLSPCFAGKSKPSITQELIFCLKHIIFNPLHRLKSGGCVFHILAIDLGNRGGFPAH